MKTSVLFIAIVLVALVTYFNLSDNVLFSKSELEGAPLQ